MRADKEQPTFKNTIINHVPVHIIYHVYEKFPPTRLNLPNQSHINETTIQPPKKTPPFCSPCAKVQKPTFPEQNSGFGAPMINYAPCPAPEIETNAYCYWKVASTNRSTAAKFRRKTLSIIITTKTIVSPSPRKDEIPPFKPHRQSAPLPATHSTQVSCRMNSGCFQALQTNCAPLPAQITPRISGQNSGFGAPWTNCAPLPATEIQTQLPTAFCCWVYI